MINTITMASDQMQNVYTPLPMLPHFVFCLIATIVYFAQYYRRGSLHYLLLLAACDLTFVTQINTAPALMIALFVAEIALLVCAGVISFKNAKKQKSQQKKKKPVVKEDDAFDDQGVL